MGGLNAKDEEKRLRSRALSQMLTTVTPALLGSARMSSNFGNVCLDHKPDLPVDALVPFKTVAEALGVKEGESQEPAIKRHHHTRDLTLKIAGFGGQGIL